MSFTLNFTKWSSAARREIAMHFDATPFAALCNAYADENRRERSIFEEI